MKITVDKNSIVTITEQLFQFFSDRILSGLLKDGEKLPSIRNLSKQINVSPMTIVKVYTQLEKGGLATTIQGKGTFVNIENNLEKLRMPSSSAQNDFQWQMAIPDYLSRSRFKASANLTYENDCYNLSIASLNYKLLPTSTILKDALTLTEDTIKYLANYPPVQGDYEFRKVMCEFLKAKKIITSPENILITTGSQQGISLICSTFIGPGDIVIMETPTYPGAIDLFKSRGATILTVPVDKEGMRTDILMSLCDKYSPKIIYTMPNFHNPTGYTMSAARKKDLLDIAKYNNCIIVEDDPWSEISYKKEKAISIKSMDTDGHVIYIKGLSKILGPAYRLASIVAEGSILTRLITAKANHDLGTSMLSQKTILDFVKSNKITNYIEKLNNQLVVKRDTVINVLKKYAPQGVTWTVPEGGINLWITLPMNYNVEKLLYHCITTQNISFLPGTVCYPNEVEFNHLRICFSYLDEEYLENTIIELCKSIKFLSSTENNNDFIPNI